MCLTRKGRFVPLHRTNYYDVFIYRFIKSIKGTALVMVHLYNPAHKSPYAVVLNVRFGFEFPTKKKIKDNK